ncbi:flavin containing amine oxidoreductase family protein [Mycobacterium xenopi 3993]|nr:flavin containing amine oxidoreductase family protein [Mycobacterium xenopi 3993]
MIAYMDTVAGVYFPRGGVRALPDALAAAAANAGVEFRYGATVSALESRAGRVVGLRTDTGERIGCDALVLTTELPDTYRLLGRTPRRLLPLRHAPSAVVVHVGCRAAEHETALHTILFGRAWEKTFRDIIDDGRLMADPSLLVSRLTAGDPALAPAGRDLLYILAPAPNTVVGTVDWDVTGRAYTDELIATVTDRLPQLGPTQKCCTS